jgi:hypothetical protein
MMGPRALEVVRFTPALLLGGSALLLLIPATQRPMRWLLAEDRPVEALTFMAFLGASVMALRLAWLHRREFPWWIRGLYLLLALAFFGVAMEEVSWGQRWVGFETPELFRRVNRQGEVTFHNIGALQGRSEWMRLCAGLGGLLAVAARRIQALGRIAAPAVLRSWFLVITAHAAVDVFNDLVPLERRFDYIMQRTSEVVELLIGFAALLYGYLNAHRFGGAFQNSPAGSPR